MLSDFSKTLLLAVARSTLNTVVRDNKILDIDDKGQFPSDVCVHNGVYVSLWRLPNMDPRASHGFLWGEKPLIQSVIQATFNSVVHETIFPRLKKEESENVLIRIHLVNAIEKIDNIDKCQLNGCGLYLEYLNHSAVFFPEVISLAGWDALEAASQLCLKSGLPGDMWRMPEMNLYMVHFTTYSESSPTAL